MKEPQDPGISGNRRKIDEGKNNRYHDCAEKEREIESAARASAVCRGLESLENRRRRPTTRAAEK